MAPYSPYQLPSVPTTPYTPWGNRKDRVTGQQRPYTFGETVTQQTGQSSGGIPQLIDYMMNDARNYQEANRQSRQQAIDTYYTREPTDRAVIDKYKGDIDQELSRLHNPDADPFTKALRSNLSSVMNNPAIMSESDISQQVAGINARNDNAFNAQENQIRNSSPFGSGARNVNLGNARAAALANSSGQTLDFRRGLAKDTSDRQLSAMDISSRLKGEEDDAISKLLGYNTQLGDTDARLQAARTQAIADLYGGSQYDIPDYSGLLQMLIGSRTGMKQSKKGTTNSLIGAGGSIGGAALGGLLGNTSLFG